MIDTPFQSPLSLGSMDNRPVFVFISTPISSKVAGLTKPSVHRFTHGSEETGLASKASALHNLDLDYSLLVEAAARKRTLSVVPQRRTTIHSHQGP